MLNATEKHHGKFPKPSRENPETSLRFPHQRHPHGLFQKYPYVVGTEATHNGQGQAGATRIPQLMCQWQLAIRGWCTVQPCVLKCSCLQRLASLHTLHPQPQTNPTHPGMVLNPGTPTHVTGNCLNPRASKGPKSLAYIWYSKSAKRHVVRKVSLEMGSTSHTRPKPGDQRGLEGRHLFWDTPEEDTRTQPYTATSSLTFRFLHPFHVFPHTET